MLNKMCDLYIFLHDKAKLNPFASRREQAIHVLRFNQLLSFVFAIHLQNLLLLPQWPRPISIFHGVGWVCLCRMWTAIMLNPLSFLPCHISSSTTSFLFHYPIYRETRGVRNENYTNDTKMWLGFSALGTSSPSNIVFPAIRIPWEMLKTRFTSRYHKITRRNIYKGE